MLSPIALPRRTRDTYETYGPGYTLLYKGCPVMCGGVMIVWSGCGDAWALFGPDARNHLRAIQFYSRRVLAMIAREYLLRRIQALVVKDFVAARRWAESLGFNVESEMLLAGPVGETLLRYVLFPLPVSTS